MILCARPQSKLYFNIQTCLQDKECYSIHFTDMGAEVKDPLIDLASSQSIKQESQDSKARCMALICPLTTTQHFLPWSKGLCLGPYQFLVSCTQIVQWGGSVLLLCLRRLVGSVSGFVLGDSMCSRQSKMFLVKPTSSQIIFGCWQETCLFLLQ